MVYRGANLLVRELVPSVHHSSSMDLQDSQTIWVFSILKTCGLRYEIIDWERQQGACYGVPSRLHVHDIAELSTAFIIDGIAIV